MLLNLIQRVGLVSALGAEVVGEGEVLAVAQAVLEQLLFGGRHERAVLANVLLAKRKMTFPAMVFLHLTRVAS